MKKLYLLSAGLIIFIISIFVGFWIGSMAVDIPKNEKTEIYAAEKSSAAVSGTAEKITPNTKMVYEYYYPVLGETDTAEESAPYFMIDLTFEDLQKYYDDWQVTYFSPEKVVMRKDVYDERNQRYIVGEKNGYITVFYENDKDGEIVREITSILVSALPEEEQKRLADGITVIGDENLIKILQDYGS